MHLCQRALKSAYLQIIQTVGRNGHIKKQKINILNYRLIPAAGRSFCDVSATGGGASEAPSIIFGTGRNLLMQFSLNGRTSKLNIDDVQLMTVIEPEIKMAAINRQEV